MKRRTLTVLTIVAIVALAILLARPNQKAARENAQKNAQKNATEAPSAEQPVKPTVATNPPQANVAAKVSTPTQASENSPTATPAPEKPVAKSVPSLATVRKEVEKDPHTTPKSIISLSLDIGERMDAVKSSEDASRLFDELSTCSLKSDTTSSAKTLCYANAGRLVKTHPELKAKFDELSGKVDPTVRENASLLR